MIALCAASGACSMVTPYHRPDLDLPTHWQGAADAGLAGTTPVTDGWWHAYQDPELDALIARGLDHNATLASAIAAVDAARGNAEQAGAPLFPSLSVNGAFDRRHRSAGASGGGSAGQSVLASASYEVDFWGLNAANANAAERLTRAAGADRDTVALTLTASIADRCFQARSLARRAAIAGSIARDARDVLQLLVAQQAAGVATQLQIEQQRTLVANLDASAAALRLQHEQAVHQLAILVGEAPERFTLASGASDAASVPIARAGLPARILDARSDIRAAEARLQAANFDVGAARAAFFPNLVLTADGGLSSTSLRQFLSSPLTSFAAALTAPVFDGGALRGRLHTSRAAAAKAVADYRQTVLTALGDVEDMLSAADWQRRIEQADGDAAAAARHAEQLATAQYRQGTLDYLSVLDTQRARYQADDALEQARLARLQASVGLFRALGGASPVEAGTDADAHADVRADAPGGANPVEAGTEATAHARVDLHAGAPGDASPVEAGTEAAAHARTDLHADAPGGASPIEAGTKVDANAHADARADADTHAAEPATPQLTASPAPFPPDSPNSAATP